MKPITKLKETKVIVKAKSQHDLLSKIYATQLVLLLAGLILTYNYL